MLAQLKSQTLEPAHLRCLHRDPADYHAGRPTQGREGILQYLIFSWCANMPEPMCSWSSACACVLGKKEVGLTRQNAGTTLVPWINSVSLIDCTDWMKFAVSTFKWSLLCPSLPRTFWNKHGTSCCWHDGPPAATKRTAVAQIVAHWSARALDEEIHLESEKGGFAFHWGCMRP